MTFTGWLQITLVLLAVLALAKPLGLYMAHVFAGERTFLSPVLRPLEAGFYRLAGLRAEQDVIIAFSACPQDILPINGRQSAPTEAHFEVLN